MTHRGLKPIFQIHGWFLIIVSILALFPAVVDAFADNPDWRTFVDTAVVGGFVGGSLILSMRGSPIRLNFRQAFLLTTSSWLLISAFGALPFVFCSLQMSFTDGFFETMSGLTTTGSTVMTGLDQLPPGILLWRSLLQWLGGIGIIVMAVALLPMMRVGGMQLFRSESSDQSEKAFPRAAQVAGMTAMVYLMLSVACAVAYGLQGMTPFEAINHAMTTISTGGYSTSDKSFGHFQGHPLQWTATIFMILGGLPFSLYVGAIQGDVRTLYANSQIRLFLALSTAAAGVIAAWLVLKNHMGVIDAVSESAFTVVSILTTTGYASSDYALWGAMPAGLILLISYLGACTGSTAGGIKMFRLEVMGKLVDRQLHRLIFPNVVYPLTYNRRPLPDDVLSSVSTFVALYLASNAVLTFLLLMTGLDLTTALSGAATAIANVGPGLGDVIGPSGTFQSLPDSAKWLLSLGMLLGRLEIFTVLVVFVPTYWRA